MISKYLVEFLGTTLLSFVIFATGNYIAIGTALAIAAMVGGPISGGAFNPAIAIALYVAGKLARRDVIPYIIVEVLGALCGMWVYRSYAR